VHSDGGFGVEIRQAESAVPKSGSLIGRFKSAQSIGYSVAFPTDIR